MTLIREWVLANWPLINFVYGLVFFVLGLSISLQSRQYSRLRLARSLSWLAGFGILHGLFEWGDLFIPIQANFLSEAVIQILHAIHYLVLALSFAFLFQFGIELFAPFSHQKRWVRIIPMVIFIIWLIVPFGLGLRYFDDFHHWAGFVKSISRYSLGLPGALLAGIGLLRQTGNPVEPVSLPHIRKMLSLAAYSLFAYAFFGGIIVDPSFYFPASLINADNFTKLVILPPMVFRSIVGGVLAFAIIRTLEVFNIETDRMIWRMELEGVTLNEKQRLARDLHDGALQQVYAVGLLAQSLKKRVPAPQKEDVERLIGIVNTSIEQLRAFLPQSQPDSSEIDIFSAIAQVTERAGAQ
jgi:signal transduction histidine kinase